MKRSKRLLAIGLMAFSIVCVAASTASATVFSVTGSGFSSSWEKRASGNGATLRYGFHTFGLNEVYVHANHNSYTHIAEIDHGGYVYKGRAIGPNRNSTAQGRHRKNAATATYKCRW